MCGRVPGLSPAVGHRSRPTAPARARLGAGSGVFDVGGSTSQALSIGNSARSRSLAVSISAVSTNPGQSVACTTESSVSARTSPTAACLVRVQIGSGAYGMRPAKEAATTTAPPSLRSSGNAAQLP